MPWVPPQRIQAKAICVIRDGNRLLLMEGHDSVKGQTFYRPLGGEIEFHETGRDAVRREFREEIDAELGELRFLGVFENLYTYDAHPGHEIVLVFEGALIDSALRERAELPIADGGRAVWMSLEVFRAGESPLYPEGLLSLVDQA